MLQTSEFGQFKQRDGDTGPAPLPPVVAAQILKKEEAEGTQPITYFVREKRPGVQKPRVFLITTDGRTFYKILSENSIAQKKTRETTGIPHTQISIKSLKLSGKFKFVKPYELFDLNHIDQGMTLNKFKALRKKKDVPIEDYLFKDRYE